MRRQPTTVRNRCRSRTGQRGVALIIVLWLTMLLAVIASGFAFSMRSEALSARNAVSLVQARAVADGAVERVAVVVAGQRVRVEVPLDPPAAP